MVQKDNVTMCETLVALRFLHAYFSDDRQAAKKEVWSDDDQIEVVTEKKKLKKTIIFHFHYFTLSYILHHFLTADLTYMDKTLPLTRDNILICCVFIVRS